MLQNCTSPPTCPDACLNSKFNATESALLAVPLTPLTYEYYVNPYNGSDLNDGSRFRPWETLERAYAQIRWMRANNTDSAHRVGYADGTNLPAITAVRPRT